MMLYLTFFGFSSGLWAIALEKYTTSYVDEVWNSLTSCTFIEVSQTFFLNTEAWV
jgi:hypothetical protein